jgi:hypothetical protein
MRQVGLTRISVVPFGMRKVKLAAPATGPGAMQSAQSFAERRKRNTGRTGSSQKLVR